MNTESVEINVILVMFTIGLVGILAHWFKSAITKKVTWNLFEYMFINQKVGSTSMFVAYCVSMWGLYSLGTFDTIKFEYISEAWSNGVLYKPFAHAVVETVAAGYLCDSALNKYSPTPTDSPS